MKRLFVFALTVGMLITAANAAKAYRFRLYLKDKEGTAYTVNKPNDFLSAKAIERRNKQQLLITESDLPVSAVYLQQLVKQGARVVTCSKWNNTVVIELSDSARIADFAAQPYINKVKKVWIAPDEVPERNKERKKEVTNHADKTDCYYGDAYTQVAVHGGDKLHEAGFKGQGMHVAVIDAGFYNADHIKFFKNLSLLGTRDFVNTQSDIYAENAHGMKVLSCMAANRPGVLVGTAPEASYWLLRSEDNDTEQPIEEDYWAAAIEFADSVGVDVINTSLGYYEFDDEADNYEYRHLDGHHSLMSNSASMAADKGMVVVCSAGNSGMGAWKKITPPADAENVITVGAMTRDGVNADFSSIGNTADNRIKPDVMAVGQRSAVSGTDGTATTGNGTSFASPIFCGMVACFWQSCPWLTAKEVINTLQQTGNRAAWPDNIFGYGVVNVWEAYQKALATHKE